MNAPRFSLPDGDWSRQEYRGHVITRPWWRDVMLIERDGRNVATIAAPGSWAACRAWVDRYTYNGSNAP